MARLARLATFLMVLSCAVPARAQQDSTAFERCASSDESAFSTGDTGCRSLLELGQEPRENLAQSLYYKGFVHLQKGEPDKAIEDYSQAIKLDADNPDYFSGRGVAYGLLGDFDLAVKDANQAIKLNPRHAAGLLLRGSIYRVRGQYAEAGTDLDLAIKIGVEKAQREFARTERAKAQSGQVCLGSPIAATAAACTVIIDDPRVSRDALATAYQRRGLAYLATGDRARALQDLADVLTIDPGRAAAIADALALHP